MIPDVTTVSYVHLYQNPIINRRVTVQNRILYKLKEVNFCNEAKKAETALNPLLMKRIHYCIRCGAQVNGFYFALTSNAQKLLS